MSVGSPRSREFAAIVSKVLESPLNLATEKELYEQSSAAKLCFEDADRDRSGNLSLPEIERLCLQMGLKKCKDDDEFLDRLDVNESGKLDLNEWIEFWLNKVSVSPNPAKQQEVIAANAFKKFDKDGSGCLDASELKRVFEQLGADMTAEENRLALQELDTDGSGLIEQQEFIDWWTNRSFKVRSGSSLISLKLKALAKKSLQLFSTDIFKAVWSNDYDLVNAFLTADKRLAVSVDQSDYGDNWTALHYAAYQGFEEIVKLLVAALEKNEINCLNGPGFTPLFYACQRGHVEVVRILLGNNADPSIWTRVIVGENQSDMILSPLDYITEYPELRQIFIDNFPKFQKVPDGLDKSSLPESVDLNSKGCIPFKFDNIYTSLREGQLVKSSIPSLPKELGLAQIKTWHFSLYTSQDISKSLLEETEQSQNKRNKCVFISACTTGKPLCCSNDAPVVLDTSQLTTCRSPSFAIAFWLLCPQFFESGVIMSSACLPDVLVGDKIGAYAAWSHICLRIETSGHLKLEIADGSTKTEKNARGGVPFAGLTIKSSSQVLQSSWSYVYIVVDTEKQEVSMILNQAVVGKASFSKEMQDINKLNGLKTSGFVFGSNSILEKSENEKFSLNMRLSSSLVSDILIYDKNLYPTPTSSVFKRSVEARSLIDINQTHLIKIDFDWLKTHFASSSPDQDIIVAKQIFISVSAENMLGFVGSASAKISVNCQDYVNILNSTLETMTLALLKSDNNEENNEIYDTDEFDTLKENFYDLKTTIDKLNSDLEDRGTADLDLKLAIESAIAADANEGANLGLSQLSVRSQGSRLSQGSRGGGGVDAHRSLSSHGDEDIHVIPSSSSKPQLAPSAPDARKSSSRPLSAAAARPSSSSSKLSSLNASGSSGSKSNLNVATKLERPADARAARETGGNGGEPIKSKKTGSKLSALKQDSLPHLTPEEQSQYKKLIASQKSAK